MADGKPPRPVVPQDAPPADTWPAQRIAWLTVGVLATAQFVNAIDRHLINLLVGPIKADLGISDSRMGMLALSFSILYALMGIVAGRWADRHARKHIIAAGVAVWSVMTMAFGLARSVGHLFAARMGVGAGEATLNPSGYSMIADCFPPEQRAKPMGVFVMGAMLGQAFTLFVGGMFVHYLVTNSITWALPWGGVLKPWQIAFVCAGLPGFLVILLVLAISEPRRRELLWRAGNGGVPVPAGHVPIGEVARFFARNLRLYLPIYLGFGLILMWELGKQLWAPTFFIRTFGWQTAQVGMALGLLNLVFGAAGTASAGWVAAWLARRGHRDAYMRAAFFAALLALPFCVLAPQMPTPALSLAMFAPAYFFGTFPFGLAPAALSTITPNQMRAQVTAVYLAVINLLGAGVGPLYIGLLTDHVFRDELLLKHSLSITALTVLPLAMLLLRAASRGYLKHLEGGKAVGN